MTSALQDYAEILMDGLPDNIKEEITLCNHSLHHGPVYLDEDYDIAECFDENVRPHDFSAGCTRIRDALDGVGDVWVDEDANDVMTSEPQGFEEDGEWIEPPWEHIRHYDRREVIAQIVGRALAEYVT